MEWMKQNILLLIAIISVCVEITPVKINPISHLLKWAGKLMNEGINKRIDDIEKELATMRQENYEKDVRDMRGEILDFANSCHNKRKHTKDEFIHIIEQITRYEELIEEHDIANGVIEVQAKDIKDLYKECLREGTLLS